LRTNISDVNIALYSDNGLTPSNPAALVSSSRRGAVAAALHAALLLPLSSAARWPDPHPVAQLFDSHQRRHADVEQHPRGGAGWPAITPGSSYWVVLSPTVVQPSGFFDLDGPAWIGVSPNGAAASYAASAGWSTDTQSFTLAALQQPSSTSASSLAAIQNASNWSTQSGKLRDTNRRYGLNVWATPVYSSN